jgi:hypothetical protein
MKKLLVCLLLLALGCPQMWAGAGPDQAHIDKIKKKIADCVDQHRRVTIETYDDRILQGSISEAGADNFVLSYAGKSTTLNNSDVKKNQMALGGRKAAKGHRGRDRLHGCLGWRRRFDRWLPRLAGCRMVCAFCKSCAF